MESTAETSGPAGGFDGRVHRLHIRVYFEDTDLSGVVYHANYLRFMERGRAEMLRALGIEHRELLASGDGYYMVSGLEIRYLQPARIDQLLTVESRLAQVRAAACIIDQRVTWGEKLLSEARVTTVYVGMNGRPRRQPRGWMETFERLRVEGPTGGTRAE